MVMSMTMSKGSTAATFSIAWFLVAGNDGTPSIYIHKSLTPSWNYVIALKCLDALKIERSRKQHTVTKRGREYTWFVVSSGFSMNY